MALPPPSYPCPLSPWSICPLTRPRRSKTDFSHSPGPSSRFHPSPAPLLPLQSGDTKPIGSAVRSLTPLATHLFGSPLWISPRKLLSLFLASAAILSYFDEDNAETVQHVLTKRDLAASFDDEVPQEVVKERAKRDEEEMVVLEDKMDEEALGEMDLEGAGRTREEVKSVCLSERGLLLARRDWVAKHGERKETGERAQQGEGAEGEGAEKVRAWAEEVVRG